MQFQHVAEDLPELHRLLDRVLLVERLSPGQDFINAGRDFEECPLLLQLFEQIPDLLVRRDELEFRELLFEQPWCYRLAVLGPGDDPIPFLVVEIEISLGDSSRKCPLRASLFYERNNYIRFD